MARINTELTLDTSQFQRSIATATARLEKFAKSAQAMGTTLTQNLSLPILGAGVAAVKTYADMEKLNKGLTAIMGSTEAAGEELVKLREVAKLPGLGLKEAVQGSINLQAVGLSANEARDTLYGFGKALAAVGKGKFELEAIQYQLTQMISKNKLLAEDYKVIQSNLPLMAKGMEAAFGTNNIDAIRETGISAKEFTLRLSQALALLPETQNVTGGLSNAFENFSDNVFISASEIGRMIATSINLEGILSDVSNGVERLSSWFKDLNPLAQQGVLLFAGLAAAAGPLFLVIGKLAGAASTLTTGFGALTGGMSALISPVGIVVAGLAGLAIAGYSIYTNWRKLNPELEDFNNYISQGTRNVIEEQSKFNGLISVLKDANISTNTRKRLVDELNSKYGQYLPNLLSEKTQIGEIKSIQEQANKVFSERIKIAALQGIVEKQTAKLVELSQTEYELELKLAKAREQQPKQLAAISSGQYVYGQGSAQLTNENIQQAASLRELEGGLKNVRNAQKALIEQSKNAQNALSGLLPDTPTVSDATGTGAVKTGGTGVELSNADKKAISEREIALSNLSARIAGFAQSITSSYGLIRADLKLTRLGESTEAINKQKDALIEYYKTIEQISAAANVFGENPIEEQIRATAQALNEAIQVFGPASEAVAILKEQYLAYSETLNANTLAVAAQNAEVERQKEAQSQYLNLVTSAFGEAASAIEKSGLTLKAALANVGRAVLKAAADVVRAKIIESVASVIADSFKKFGLLGAVVGAGAGALVGSLFSGVINSIAPPKLASGGLAYSQTLAVVGDNPNAGTDPEVIAPLSKLKDYMNGGGGYFAEARISGSDLLILVTDAERRSGRIR